MARIPTSDNRRTTRKGTLRERLEALAAFGPVFAQQGFRATDDVPWVTRDADTGVIVYRGVTYADDMTRFVQMAYDHDWVVYLLPWPEWRQTEQGRLLMQDPATVAAASADDLAHVLTTCIRADRFCDGYLASAFEAGLIGRVVARARTLLRDLPA